VVGSSMGASVIWSYVELFGHQHLGKLVFVDQSPLQARGPAAWPARRPARAGGDTEAAGRFADWLALPPCVMHSKVGIKGTTTCRRARRRRPDAAAPTRTEHRGGLAPGQPGLLRCGVAGAPADHAAAGLWRGRARQPGGLPGAPAGRGHPARAVRRDAPRVPGRAGAAHGRPHAGAGRRAAAGPACRAAVCDATSVHGCGCGSGGWRARRAGPAHDQALDSVPSLMP